MFSEDVFDLIIRESTRYAHQNNRLHFSLTKSSIKRFVGFLLLSGYASLPQEQLYWSLSEDVSCPLVRNAMSRSIYLGIKRNLHLADNSCLDKTDKLAKIRPYVHILAQNFMQYEVFAANLSIDEQMIPYFGKHSSKMFMRGKPIRFGYKVWCLCSSDGYLFNFEIYTGKSQEKSIELGLGGDVVTRLLKVVKNPSEHVVYFDNFFTSLPLLAELSNLGFCATGTVRENRCGKAPILSVKDIKKKSRGSYDSIFEQQNGINIVRWHDNSVVSIASNWDTVDPPGTAKRYSRQEKKSVNIQQPKVIENYNKHMGGVDLLDNFVSMHRIKIKGKKWWWPIFTNFIDVAKVNAWKLYKLANGSKISLLDFQRSLAIALLSTPEEVSEDEIITCLAPQNNIGRPSSFGMQQLNATKKDKTSHLIQKNPDNKRRRCKYCSSQTITICNKCNVPLHAKCFKEFHTTKC